MKQLIDELRIVIKEAEINPRDYFYFVSSLSNAKGILSAIDNLPKGRNEYVNRDILERAIWNLKNSLINKM